MGDVPDIMPTDGDANGGVECQASRGHRVGSWGLGVGWGYLGRGLPRCQCQSTPPLHQKVDSLLRLHLPLHRKQTRRHRPLR